MAWRFKTDNLGPRPEFNLQSTPLMVKGVLYSTGGTRRAVVALDAATGEQLWMHSENEGPRGTAAPRQLSGRGLAYWTDGKEERILYVTPGYQLVALDAKTGNRVPGFGTNGIVDLKQNIDQTIDPLSGEIGLHATPVVARNVVIVGAAHRSGGVPTGKTNVKGYVRGFDVRTGKRLWIFHTIPEPGEFGNETWDKDSWVYTGNAGVWAQISVDEQLGLAYLPVESPTGDYFGGPRPGNGLFGETLVAVDLQTGKRKWHYQLVHHGIWDMDIPCAPILARRDDQRPDDQGRRAADEAGVPLRLQSRDRRADLADRREAGREGHRAWRVVFADAAVSDQAGGLRDAGPRRRRSDRLHAGAARRGREDRLALQARSDLHAAGRQHARRSAGDAGRGDRGWRHELARRLGRSRDADSLRLVEQGRSACSVSCRRAIATKNDLAYVQGNAETGARTTGGSGANAGPGGGGEGAGAPQAPTVRGLPLVKPPYGQLTAIDMKRGEILWQVAHGETPDNVRNNPALKGADDSAHRSHRHRRPARDEDAARRRRSRLRSDTIGRARRDAARVRQGDGKEVGAVYMPAPQTGSPMTYMLNGRQYIVVAVSGAGYSGELIAFRLPRRRGGSSDRSLAALNDVRD